MAAICSEISDNDRHEIVSAILADIEKEKKTPPVPIKTYEWEDLKREKEKGKYPFTYLKKESNNSLNMESTIIQPIDHSKKVEEDADDESYEGHLIKPIDHSRHGSRATSRQNSRPSSNPGSRSTSRPPTSRPESGMGTPEGHIYETVDDEIQIQINDVPIIKKETVVIKNVAEKKQVVPKSPKEFLRENPNINKILENTQSMSVDEERFYLDKKVLKHTSLDEDYNKWSKLK